MNLERGPAPQSPEEEPQYDRELEVKLSELHKRKRAAEKEIAEVDRLMQEARDERNTKHLAEMRKQGKVNW